MRLTLGHLTFVADPTHGESCNGCQVSALRGAAWLLQHRKSFARHVGESKDGLEHAAEVLATIEEVRA